MKLADVSIKRPVFATMMIMALVVLGLFALTRLNIDLYPDVDIPVVVVTTALPGAGPEQIESDVTKPIEDAINPVAGVDHISSTSQEGVSIIVTQFKLEVDGKSAAQEVREKIAAIRSTLPTDIKEPVIQRYDPASQPILTLTVAGQRPEKELTTYTKDVIKKRLENVPGVGSVDLIGGAEREIHVDVDLERLKAYALSIQDVVQSVGASNVEIPGGNLEQGTRQLLLRTMGKFRNIEDFGKIIIVSKQGNIVRLNEVAQISDATVERTSLSRYNGKPAVGLNIMKQSGANTVQVADQVEKELQVLQKELPGDVRVSVAQDYSVFIRDSVSDVLFDIFYGGLLAVIVVYLFLANIRSTIISAIALPTSIITTFMVMYILNFTLNMMTLLALSLAVGLLIDDAIVVIENIYRHLDHGETPMEAAKSATSEIGLAVLATTFTIVAVFVPVAFMPGIVGRFFYQFGITVSVAVLVSLFVAFTLTPMLSSRWLKKEDEHLSKSGNLLHKVLYYFNHSFEWLNGKYRSTLAWALKHRLTIVLGSIAVFIFSVFMMRFLGTAFFPDTDRGEFTIQVNAAAGTSIDQTDRLCRIIEDRLHNVKEVTNLLTTVGGTNVPVNRATILVKLTKKDERQRSQSEVISSLRSELINFPGANLNFSVEGGPGGQEKPVTLSIRGAEIDKINEIAEKVRSAVHSTPGAVDIESSLEASKPEVRVRIDRDKASDLGVNVYSVASSVRSMVDGFVATKYQEGNEQYDVRVRLKENNRKSISDIENLSIMSSKSGPNDGKINVRLGDVADVFEGVGPSKINRYDRQREIRVDANVSGRLMGEVLGDAMKKVSKLPLPSGYSVSVVGQGQQQAESFLNILISLALAIIFVYIVLAMQFESFVYPFSIMLSLPMAIIGAIMALIAFNSALSVMSMIGIIMLMGLVTKNAILLIDFTNTLRERGLSRTEALLQAGPTRLRPILMTTLAMIFGMIPVALGLGEGSEFRSPMGQAVIGGLITSTMLTLLVVPVVYTIIDDFSMKKAFGWATRLLPFGRKAKYGSEPSTASFEK
ncbi:MAG: efflux RND transporter permease subunit [Ignavibacteria bacterium]|jgi:HAE1 family hydrophobic/amphiphilic exporter-1|nr:efflux RND transporter permease subunit [Ignavibacteria bacterium]MCU7502003.1 efflux RND transporter permease subunit [Ignavibacteria bacterium]MCU7516971.1 efflux RND transporter permease subunit [Ignavibacteria bacterium]